MVDVIKIERRSDNVAAGITRFYSAYYISNALLLASYVFVRGWFLLHSDLKYSRLGFKEEIFPKEKQTFALLAVVLGFKFVRRQSTDGFLADGFFFSKGAIAVLSFYMDLRICVYYMLFFLVLSLLYPQPVFRGESRLVNLTPAALAHVLKEQADEKTKIKWLIVFFAPWLPQCVHLEPVFAEISMKYTSKQLRFGKVDVSRWPIAAKDHKIFIQNGNVDQLPTIIMFENGKETGRIPHVYDDGTVAVKRLYKDDIIAAFGLNDVKKER